MVLYRFLDTLGIRSPSLRVILGASIAALAVSLGTAGVLWLLGMKASAGLAGGLGAAAVAAYGVSAYRSNRT